MLCCLTDLNCLRFLCFLLYLNWNIIFPIFFWFDIKFVCFLSFIFLIFWIQFCFTFLCFQLFLCLCISFLLFKFSLLFSLFVSILIIDWIFLWLANFKMCFVDLTDLFCFLNVLWWGLWLICVLLFFCLFVLFTIHFYCKLILACLHIMLLFCCQV